MNAIIAFTPAQVLAWCTAIITISGAMAVLFNLIGKALAPNKLQNARLDAVEARLKEHDTLFKNDLRRFEEIEDGNRVIQRALLALLAHSIDGNDVDSLRKAKGDLERYLIER